MANPKKDSKPKKISPTPPSKLQISVDVPSLSAMDPNTAAQIISEIKTNIFNSINDAELRKSLDKWVRDNQDESQITERDYTLLKSVITEYLDSFMLFGYNTQGERIIIQHAKTPKDRDAVMEFLKTIFIQQQQTNFLDVENMEDDEDDEDDQEDL